jgi:uroporphyrinogen III methyltransferase/synthase
MTVFLVGAGPGDPGLITVRGAEVLARADVVVHDRLSARALLGLAPAGAERIDVGKQPGGRSTPQAEIDRLLVERGSSADTVVRLKGGDPFVFARGGEEAAALAAAGVPFEVVPGITSAVAVPAYAGIPVTRRYSSTSVTIVTGHEDPATAGTSVDWEAIGGLGGTVVVLMGAANRAEIARRLMAGGRPPSTPVAAVRWGTRADQSTIVGTLATLGELPVRPPVTIVVGDVVEGRVPWFETRPLFGRRVVVTRTRAQASVLASALAAAGAEVVEFPVIEVVDPADGGAALDAAARRAGEFDWVVLTSPNGARRFLEMVGDGRRLGSARIAVIGTGTGAAVAERFLEPDLIPDRFVAESLLESFPEAPAAGGRVLVARAEVAREVLPTGLRAKGWTVEVVDAYRTVAARPDPAALESLAGADIVTFTSSSTVTNFLATAGTGRVPPAVACIGPITAATAREAGIAVDVEATEHSIDGLVAAIVDWVHAGGGMTAGPRP